MFCFSTFPLNPFPGGRSGLGSGSISPVLPDVTGWYVACAAGQPGHTPHVGSSFLVCHLVPGRHQLGQPRLQLGTEFSAQLLCTSWRDSEFYPRGFFIYPLLASSCGLWQGHGTSPVTSCLALLWRASIPGKQSGWFPLGRLCLCQVVTWGLK